MRINLKNRIIAFLLGLTLLGSWGCSDAPVVTEGGGDEKRLEGFGRAYMAFTQANRRPPASEQELTPFLQKEGDVNELTTSSDGQKWKVYWGVDPMQGMAPPPGAKPKPELGASPDFSPFTVIAHAQSPPSDGRVLAFTNQGVMEMTQEEFRASLPKR